MTALELYRQDGTFRAQGNALPSRQQYYIDLRDALHGELTGDGYSPLLEELFIGLRQQTMQRIYVLDYAAVMECYSLIVSGQGLRDASEYVPHLRQGEGKVAWADLKKRGAHTMRVSEDILEKVRTLRTVSHQVYTARTDGFDSEEEGASRREFEQLQNVARLLNERCKALEDERDALQRRIRDLEEGVIDAQVAHLLEGRYAQAEKDLADEYARKREAADAAFRARYAQQMAERAQRQQDEDREEAARHAEVTQAYAELRRQMTEDLARWQQRLDRTECRMLAATYVSLYGMLTRDVDALILTAQCGEAPTSLRDGLDGLQTNGHLRLRQLEQAMLRLGLTVLRPEAGEAFDPLLHQGAGGTGRITRCATPGVCLQATGEALVKAEVERE